MGVEDREIGRGGGRKAGPFSLLVLFLPSRLGHLDLRIDDIKKKEEEEANKQQNTSSASQE